MFMTQCSEKTRTLLMCRFELTTPRCLGHRRDNMQYDPLAFKTYIAINLFGFHAECMRETLLCNLCAPTVCYG